MKSIVELHAEQVVAETALIVNPLKYKKAVMILNFRVIPPRLVY